MNINKNDVTRITWVGAIYAILLSASWIFKDEQLIPQDEQKMYDCTFKEHQHLNC